MNRLIRHKILLILFLAALLRLWNLAGNPPHLRNDEASLGYNAYSILETGKDEHGEFLPIIFKSFGDWKMGLYVYLTVPFVAVFGLNELSVRLPSALFGIISVWLIFKIVLQMFESKKLALISSLVFTLSPLYITFSRGAWEANVSLTLTLFAIFFFLKGIKINNKFIFLSATFFGLTFLASHTAKLSSPIILATLIISYYKQVKKINIRTIALSILISLILFAPAGLSFWEGKVSRLTTLSIFSYYPDKLALFESIATRWFSLYSARTFFIKGDINPQHTPPNTGPLLLLDGIFLVAGIVTLIRSGTYQQNIFIWVSLSLLPLTSALTIEKANFERVLPMFVPVVIVVSLGIKYLWEKLKTAKSFAKFAVVLLFFYVLNYVYFLDQYFIHGSKKNDAWQYGYKQVVDKITSLQNQYQKIIVQQGLEHPYIFFLFYQKYDPLKYQGQVSQVFIPNKEGKDMGLVSGVGQIKFEEIDWLNTPSRDTLYIMPVYKLEQQAKIYPNYKIIDEIKDLNGFALFKIVAI